MVGLIILTSMVFVAVIVYKIAKTKMLKYILSPIISLLYGFMLFFVGMGVSNVLFNILALIPVIYGVYIIMQKNR